jgi:hypothetical protein
LLDGNAHVVTRGGGAHQPWLLNVLVAWLHSVVHQRKPGRWPSGPVKRKGPVGVVEQTYVALPEPLPRQRFELASAGPTQRPESRRWGSVATIEPRAGRASR